MAEFIGAAERPSGLSTAVSASGSARICPDNPCQALAVEWKLRPHPGRCCQHHGGGAQGGVRRTIVPVGLNIGLPRELHGNTWRNIALNLHHFFARKFAFVKYVNTCVVLTSGFGRPDELTEVLAFIQAGKTRRFPVTLVRTTFWRGLPAWFRSQLADKA